MKLIHAVVIDDEDPDHIITQPTRKQLQMAKSPTLCSIRETLQRYVDNTKTAI